MGEITNRPLVSIIIPVYNAEGYINKCMDSVLGQTYDNLEIILIDDGSTDKSAEICDELAAKDKRIRVIHKENGGASDARNMGLDIATGDCIGFVDSDDWIDNNMYEVLVEEMLNEDADIVCCAFKYVKDDKVIDNSDGTKKVYTGIQMFESYISGKNGCLMSPAVWNRLFKKEIFDDIRFTKGRMYEDKEISTKTLVKAKKGVYINKALYNYYQRGGSVSHSGVTDKSIDDFIYMNTIQNEYVKKYLSEDIYIKSVGIYYCLLLNDYCVIYRNKSRKEGRKKLAKELKKVGSTARTAIKKKENIPSKDKKLICLSTYSSSLYYVMNKLLK